jgi:AraC family transcriptional regulator
MQRILPVLTRIHAQIESDLSLDALAQVAGLSPFHFHRTFRATVGETLKGYTERVRLERAAFCLLVHESSVLRIALECGFRSPEVFSRAFRRHFGCTPSEYRASPPLRRAGATPDPRGRGGGEYELSATRPVELSDLHLAFIRHVGPYEAVPDSLWRELAAFVKRRRWPTDILLGIGHDSPAITAAGQLRFDAAIVVPKPFSPHARIGYQLLPRATYAITTHVGHFATLGAAYGRIWMQAQALTGYEIVGLPCVEIYRCDVVNADHHLNRTDIHIPLRPKEKQA